MNSDDSDEEDFTGPPAKLLKSGNLFIPLQYSKRNLNVEVMSGKISDDNAVMEVNNTRFALLPSPTEFIMIGKHLDRFGETEDTHQERFNMTEDDIQPKVLNSP